MRALDHSEVEESTRKIFGNRLVEDDIKMLLERKEERLRELTEEI